MPRIKPGVTTHARHKKVLNAAKGFQHARHKRFKVAHEAVLHAGKYAYVGRRLRKRDMKTLWIGRINSALRSIDTTLSYSVFVKLLKDNKIELNRKMLAEIAITDAASFKTLVSKVYGK